MNHFVVASSLVASLIATSHLTAQQTSATVTIGGTNARGCQDNSNPPNLTGGVPASADLKFDYDASAHTLTLTVANTSPVVGTDANPVVTRVFFNLPVGAVNSIALLGQSAAGGATPNFSMSHDPSRTGSQSKAGCFGTFVVGLDVKKGGITNPAAPRSGSPAQHQIVGPVEFLFQLVGPGTGNIDATTIANAFSRAAGKDQVTQAVKFQGGGANAAQSGWISSARNNCRGSLWVNGEPKIGQSIELCQSFARGCHGCLIASLSKGPTVINGTTFPIGLPVLFFVPFPPVSEKNEFCLPIDIPNDTRLQGLEVYFALLNFAPSGAVEVSPRYELVIQ